MGTSSHSKNEDEERGMRERDDEDCKTSLERSGKQAQKPSSPSAAESTLLQKCSKSDMMPYGLGGWSIYKKNQGTRSNLGKVTKK